jgi:hypothetical protein
MNRTPRIVARTLRGGAKDDGSFDDAFWGAQGAEVIFGAAWDMIADARTMRGEDGDEPRLQRAVCRTLRRGR